MIPEVRRECEELNNSPRIPAAATKDGRPLTRYANSRSNGAARCGWRRREFGDQGAENESVETWRASESVVYKRE